MLNQPISSSPHWRIPATSTTPRRERFPWRAARRVWRWLVAGALVGSVLGPPLLVMAALISLFAPSLTGGHHLAPAFIVAALFWLFAAIVGAHAKSRSPADEDDHLSLP